MGSGRDQMKQEEARRKICPLLSTAHGMSAYCQTEGCMFWMEHEEGSGECTLIWFMEKLVEER